MPVIELDTRHGSRALLCPCLGLLQGQALRQCGWAGSWSIVTLALNRGDHAGPHGARLTGAGLAEWDGQVVAVVMA